MKKTIKKKWVKALLSDKYEQTIETLCDGDSYCCLGVLCRVIEGQLPSVVDLLENGDGELDSKTLNFCQLSKDNQKKLVSLNDEKRLNFKQIAAYIDRYL